MRLKQKSFSIFSIFVISFGVLSTPSNAAKKPATPKVKINKPSAPAIISITSTVPKKNKVNLTITISLPENNGGAVVTGSKVSAKGAACSMTKLKTTCTIKNVKTGKSFNFSAQSKNKKGFGAKSSPVSFTANGESWAAQVAAEPVSTPSAQPSYPCGSGSKFLPCWCEYVVPGSTHYDYNVPAENGNVSRAACTGASAGAYSWVDYCNRWFSLPYDESTKSCSTPPPPPTPNYIYAESSMIKYRIDYISAYAWPTAVNSAARGDLDCYDTVRTINNTNRAGEYVNLHNRYRLGEISEFYVIEFLNRAIDIIDYCK